MSYELSLPALGGKVIPRRPGASVLPSLLDPRNLTKSGDRKAHPWPSLFCHGNLVRLSACGVWDFRHCSLSAPEAFLLGVLRCPRADCGGYQEDLLGNRGLPPGLIPASKRPAGCPSEVRRNLRKLVDGMLRSPGHHRRIWSVE